jgi:hypothetical protein
MTDEELLAADANPQWVHVRVKATDYEYEGWLVTAFGKRRPTQVRCVVEDDNGRLFIHNASQLTAIP